MLLNSNKELFKIAKQYIPGGVNSPVRSFNSVGGEPFFTKMAHDCYLIDMESKSYIDYVSSWGANIVGHANEYVIDKVIKAIKKGFSFGTPTELEIEFAKKINQLMPHIEKFRVVSSGTEAVMSAIRLARGYTNRKYIVKFEGCYHGHSDNLLVSAGSGLATFGNPSSKGICPSSVENTLILDYNDTESLFKVFENYGRDIACVIIEPFAGNMNLVKPTTKFINALKTLCEDYKTLLIFDEVMTGFRVALGGARELLNIKADITILGKIIGGGMPLAGFGGRADIMDFLSPLGAVYQAGTLSGNPIALTCGLANLDLITIDGFYSHLINMAKILTDGLLNLAKKYEVRFSADYIGGMFGFYFMPNIPINFKEVKTANNDQFKIFFHKMLEQGVYFAPSMYEANFLCIKHELKVIEDTLFKAEKAFSLIADFKMG